MPVSHPLTGPMVDPLERKAAKQARKKENRERRAEALAALLALGYSLEQATAAVAATHTLPAADMTDGMTEASRADPPAPAADPPAAAALPPVVPHPSPAAAPGSYAGVVAGVVAAAAPAAPVPVPLSAAAPAAPAADEAAVLQAVARTEQRMEDMSQQFTSLMQRLLGVATQSANNLLLAQEMHAREHQTQVQTQQTLQTLAQELTMARVAREQGVPPSAPSPEQLAAAAAEAELAAVRLDIRRQALTTVSAHKQWADKSPSDKLAAYAQLLRAMLLGTGLAAATSDELEAFPPDNAAMDVESDCCSGDEVRELLPPLPESALPVPAPAVVAALVAAPARVMPANVSKLPMPGKWSGRPSHEGATTPENWLSQVTAYMTALGQTMSVHMQFYLDGPALQWWSMLTQKAGTDGSALTTDAVREAFLAQYGNPLRY